MTAEEELRLLYQRLYELEQEIARLRAELRKLKEGGDVGR